MTAQPNEGMRRLFRHLADLRRTGANSWVALCPFHDDRTPSLHIDIKRNIDGRIAPFFFCTACGKVFDQLLAAFDIAAFHLFEGLALETEAARRSSPTIHRDAPATDREHETVERAHSALLQDGERLELLSRHRGLSEQTIRCHRLGFFSGYVVPIYLDRILINRRTYRPGWDPSGLRGSKWDAPPGSSMALYPDPVGMQREKGILLVEGELDALIARQYGFPAWTHTGGATAGLRPEWKAYFRAKSVALCYDCDSAGRSGALKAARQLHEWGCTVKVVDLALDPAEDVTDLFVKYRRSEADLWSLIRSTPRFEEFE